MQSLHTFYLHALTMNESTIEAICQLKNLKKLFLPNCVFESASMIYPVLNLINLETLHAGTCLENYDEFLIKLPDKLKNLTEFHMDINLLTDAGVLALTKLEKLDQIVLKNRCGLFQVTDASIKKFKNMQKIFFMDFPMITDDSIIDILNNSPYLEFIHLEKTGVTFKSVQHVIDIMRTRKNDTRLVAKFDLPYNRSELRGNITPNLDLYLAGIIYTDNLINCA